MKPRYFKIDYDNDLVIEYERQGDCNECGACCTGTIMWQIQDRLDVNGKANAWNPRNGERAIQAKSGIYTSIYINGRLRYFRNITIEKNENRCSMLTASNRCRIHAGKRLIASAWPMLPDHVQPFPDCSYRFVEVGRWTVPEFEEKVAAAL